MKPTIYLGADHAGFDMKTSVREHLELAGYTVEDLGAHELDPADDYPQYGEAVAEAVLKHPGSLGVLSCGNAEGICIVANKFDGIRAGVGYATEAARTMRTDDNANVICIPGRIETNDDPLAIVDAFVTTPFSGAERHVRRLEQVREIEKADPSIVVVAPAVLAANEEEFVQKLSESDVRQLANLYQVDVLDGSMFGATCFEDALIAAALANPPDIELHLMVQDPLPVVHRWHTHYPNLKRAIIHAEIDQDVLSVIEKIKAMNIEVGLAINPDTHLEAIERLTPMLDLLLIMGVEPGASGQAFLGDPILEKIAHARRQFGIMTIAVDGGVTLDNARSIVDAGANQLCVSSAIWKSVNRARAFAQLSHPA